MTSVSKNYNLRHWFWYQFFNSYPNASVATYVDMGKYFRWNQLELVTTKQKYVHILWDIQY